MCCCGLVWWCGLLCACFGEVRRVVCDASCLLDVLRGETTCCEKVLKRCVVGKCYKRRVPCCQDCKEVL